MSRKVLAMRIEMCSSLPCLETRCTMYTTDQLFHDKLGYSWCPHCIIRGQLMNWSLMYGQPEIHAGRFMVGPGKLWEVCMTMGKDELVEAIRRVVWPCEREAA